MTDADPRPAAAPMEDFTGNQRWHRIYNAAADAGTILNDDVVTAIDKAVDAAPLGRPAEPPTDVDRIARAFVAYYTANGGCSNCGGLPHTNTCFVGQFAYALNFGGTTLAPLREAFQDAAEPSSWQPLREVIMDMWAYVAQTDDRRIGDEVEYWAKRLAATLSPAPARPGD